MSRSTIKNHLIFALVMRRKKLAIRCLELILQKKIRDIVYIESEKTAEVSAQTHGIRLDVYCENEDAIYNIEMQAYQMEELPKRIRYYQDMMDMILLEKGEDYDALKKNIVIFICTFDPFYEDRHIYTFENRCIQDTELRLGDDTTKIILNTKGKLDDIPRPLKLFLNYIETGEVSDEYTKELDEAVREVRTNEKWREPIMTVEMMLKDAAYEARMEGIAEGKEEGKAEGLAEGLAEGASMEKRETVKRMLEAGMAIESIRIATGLTEEEILSVQKAIS